MGELGSRLPIERGNVGHSLPTVTRACAPLGGQSFFFLECGRSDVSRTRSLLNGAMGETAPQTMVLTVTNGMNQKSVRSLSQSISVPLVYYFYLAATDAFDSMAFPKIILPAVV